MEVSLWKRIKCFLSTPCQKNLKPQQSPFILDLDLRKTRPGKSHGFCDAIISKKFHFQKVFGSYENEKLAFSNSSRLRSIFDTLHFLDGPVWTVGLTVEIKLLFRFPWHIEDTALGPRHSEHKSNVFSPQYARQIWNHSFISMVMPTIHTNPSQKQSFSKMLLKLEEFEITRFSFWWGWKTF